MLFACPVLVQPTGTTRGNGFMAFCKSHVSRLWAWGLPPFNTCFYPIDAGTWAPCLPCEEAGRPPSPLLPSSLLSSIMLPKQLHVSSQHMGLNAIHPNPPTRPTTYQCALPVHSRLVLCAFPIVITPLLSAAAEPKSFPSDSSPSAWAGESWCDLDDQLSPILMNALARRWICQPIVVLLISAAWVTYGWFMSEPQPSTGRTFSVTYSAILVRRAPLSK